jgi:hypothetical protein
VVNEWFAPRSNNRMRLTGGEGCPHGSGSPFGEPMARSQRLEAPPGADPCVGRALALLAVHEEAPSEPTRGLNAHASEGTIAHGHA